MNKKKVICLVFLITASISLSLPVFRVKAWEIDANGTATYIVDGDTLDIDSIGRVRLADIDCPEMGDPGAEEATQFLESLVYNKNVYVDIDDIYGTGPYGRIIAVLYVYYDENHLKNVNQAILDAGHAEIADYDNEFNPYEWSLLVEYDSGGPTWNPNPSDKVVECNTPFIYDVDATDPSGIQSYWVNDSINFQINSEGVITNKSKLSVGDYWLEIGVRDTDGNENNATVKIRVQDTIAPTWKSQPKDQLLNIDESFSYNVDATDPSGIQGYWINNTSCFRINENGLISNRSCLIKDLYWLEIGVNDTYGNSNMEIIKLTIGSYDSSSENKSGVSFLIFSLIVISIFFIGYTIFLVNKFMMEF